jgi:DNA-binding response OmpR family regulator
METNNISILLAEDDGNLSLVLEDYLKLVGYKVVLCHDGEEGLNAFKKQHFDLCILDVMMPKKDGFSLAEDIRKLNTEVPIIFLTAKSLHEDRVKGFKVGCDDYISKPFSTEELSLRVKVILKRCMAAKGNSIGSVNGIINLGIFKFDFINMELKSEKSTIPLTRKESSLLKVLCEYENQLLTRELALNKVWGGNDYFVGRSMDVFIAKLRKYLKEDPNISIMNIHGSGFKLEVKKRIESY